MNTQDILLKHVVPGVGCGIALILFCSPLPAVLRVNKAKNLGDLNALPFAALAITCASLVFYALVLKDYYIYFGQMPGILLGMYYVFTCYKFSKEAAQDMLRNILLGGVFLFWVVGLVSMAASLSLESTKTLWGATTVACLGVYYVAPLSSVAKVISERDSSSLHWPLCTMNIINGMLWFAYGLAIKDWFVCLPNGIGAGFNVICLAMCFVFPSKNRKQQDPNTGSSAERVLDNINPGANWGALRLQSFARPPPGAPNTAAAGASAGGFFDLTQLRWRTGRALSFRDGSFLQRMLSGGQRSSTAMPPAGSAASGAALVPGDVLGKDAGAGLDQQCGVGGDVKAGGDDVEQAYVVADARWRGQQQQQQQQQHQQSPAVSTLKPKL